MNAVIPVITIDGHAGTGKGTISRLLAERLGWHYLDSGILYRVLAYWAQSQQVSLADEQRLVALARELPIELVLGANHALHILLADNDVSVKLRVPAVDQAASKISALPAVRAALLQRQRDFRQEPGLVTDGRDMGTVVFPDATVKLFFTANIAERARRRLNQLKLQGINANLQDILHNLAERDQRDQERLIAPLKPAEDAIVIDTTDQTIEQVFARVLEVVMPVVKNLSL